jgi:hypothetical protein
VPSLSQFPVRGTIAHRDELHALGLTNARIRTERQNAIHGVGVVLLRFPVLRLRQEPSHCGHEMHVLVA